MERTTSLSVAREIMGLNFIGPNELALIAEKMSIQVPTDILCISFDQEELKVKHDDYLLILGVSHMQNGEPLKLESLRNCFGINPEKSEPCFYNQDWYLKEDFINKQLDVNWYLIRKNVVPESRKKDPEMFKDHYNFPSAILCAYSFFAYWFYAGECLWKHDFIWCNDID